VSVSSQQLDLNLNLDKRINAETSNFVRQMDTHMAYAEVLLDMESAALAGRTFTYSIPAALQPTVQAGVLVEVPFAHNPSRIGVVLALSSTGPQVARPISRVLSDAPLLDAPRLQWLAGMAAYTATPMAYVMSTALPSALLQNKGKHAEIPRLRQAKTQRWVKALPDGLALTDTITNTLTPRQQSVLDQLVSYGAQGCPVKTLLVATKTTESTLKRLVDKHLASFYEQTIHASTTQLLNTGETGNTPATPATLSLTSQQHAMVKRALALSKGECLWIEGVTGSGKTQVYMAIAKHMLAQGQSVLFLVPEIALTTQLAQRFMAQFPDLAMWHSQLNTRQRVDTWWRVHSGEIKLVIGPRSALFLPMVNLGAILIDEAHDASFKQDTPAPRYDTRREAVRLASLLPNCRVVCGSATPDVSFLHEARQQDCHAQLTQRFGRHGLAPVTLIDTQKEKQLGQQPIVSSKLQQALTQTIAQQEQAIVLVNRRGFYTQLTCTACEHTLGCPHCSVSLTMHQPTHSVRCHYCGFDQPVPPCCPACGNFDLRQTGVGTQRVTQTLQAMLPEARILRLDSDVMRHKNAHLPIFRQFAEGQADILVGTQMVAKGLDVANVTCVGVIGADSGLNLPDYMATERTFQLLTQVAGRAGRGDKPGHVWVQTRLPHHPVLGYAQGQDMAGFYTYELALRQADNFPPFSQLIRLLCSSLSEEEAQQGITWINQQLRQLLADKPVDWLGPAPCAITKIQDRYRYQLLVKNIGDGSTAGPNSREGIRQRIANWYQQAKWPKTLTCLIDIDCQNLL
jgi:primosomal protein N' (replication factor Y) (superfamily II helicase)